MSLVLEPAQPLSWLAAAHGSGQALTCSGLSGMRKRLIVATSFVCRSVDPFAKKDWYDVKAPSMFAVRNVGKTLVTRTQGTKVHGS